MGYSRPTAVDRRDSSVEGVRRVSWERTDVEELRSREVVIGDLRRMGETTPGSGERERQDRAARATTCKALQGGPRKTRR